MRVLEARRELHVDAEERSIVSFAEAGQTVREIAQGRRGLKLEAGHAGFEERHHAASRAVLRRGLLQRAFLSVRPRRRCRARDSVPAPSAGRILPLETALFAD